MGTTVSIEQLEKAVKDNDTKFLQTHLSSSSVAKLRDQRLCDNKRETLLTLASKHSRSAVIKLLVELKTNVKVTNHDNQTALHLASSHGLTDVIPLLIDAKAEIDMIDAHHMTPLTYSINSGHLSIAKTLLSKKADVDIGDEKGKGTALVIAVEKRNVAAVKLLLEVKASVNTKNAKSETPLALLAQTPPETIVTTSEKEGKSSSEDESKSQTPSEVILDLILTHTPDVEESDYEGKTALHHVSHHGHLNICRSLLTLFKSHLNTKTQFGDTPLHLAAAAGHVDIVNLLLDAHADPEVEDASGNTTLLVAAENNQPAIISLLTTHSHGKGVKMKHQNKQGHTAQYIATKKGFKACSKLLPYETYVDESELNNILEINAGGRDKAEFMREFGMSDIGKPEASGGPLV